MKINKNRFLISLLVSGLIFGFATPSVLNANEQDDITDEVNIEETNKSDEEVTTLATQQNNADTITTRSTIPADWAFTNDSRPLEQALLQKYPHLDGFAGGTVDGYISISEANAYSWGSIGVPDQGVTGTIDGIEHFTQLTYIHLQNNQFTGEIPAGLGDISTLQYCYLYGNNFSGELPTKLGDLSNLKDFRIHSNNFSGEIPASLGNLNSLEILFIYDNDFEGTIPASVAQLPSLRRLFYHHTNIEASDLTGTNLGLLGVTKEINANLSNVTYFYITGSRERKTGIIRVIGDSGFISKDTSSGYYVIEANKNATYDIGLWHMGDSLVETDKIDLSMGGLMDDEGNLILGASEDNIVDGKIVLPEGGTIINESATYTFDENTVIDNGTITTDGKVTVDKYVSDGTDIDLAGISTAVTPPEGETVSIDLFDSLGTTSLKEGTMITDNEGNVTYVVDEATLNKNGELTTAGTTIVVPADKVSDIVVNEDGSIVLPYPTEVVYSDGTVSTPEGGVIYDPKTGNVITIDLDTLEVTGIPTDPIDVGDSFTLTANIPNGEWNYDTEYFDAKVIGSTSVSKAAIVGNSVIYTAKQNGLTKISYSINGVTKEYSIRVLDKQIEPKPEEPKEPEDPSKPILPEILTSKPSTKPSVSGGTTISGNTVNTGDTTNLASLYVLLGSSLLAFVVIMKRRKEVK